MRKLAALLALAITALVLAAACGGDDGDAKISVPLDRCSKSGGF